MSEKRMEKEKRKEKGKWEREKGKGEWSGYREKETGLPGIAQTAGSDHRFSICCPNSDKFLTDGCGLYNSFGDWANALECWRSLSLRLVIPGIAVSPGVTHSDSRIVFVTSTVVKPQQPTEKA